MSSAPSNEVEAIALFQSLGAWQADPKIVHADRQAINDEHIACLSLLPNIEHLVLGRTSITDAAMSIICALMRLTLLDVSDNEITDAGAVHLTSLSSLRCLGIYGTKITDSSTTVIGSLRTIDTLNVSYTQITDVGLLNLAGLENLKVIELHHTKVTSNGIAGFRDTLPECLIVTDDGILPPVS